VLNLGDNLGFPVELLDSEILAELLNEGEERDGLPEGHAAPFEPRRVLSGRSEPPTELEREPRLADAGLPSKEDYLPPPSLQLLKKV